MESTQLIFPFIFMMILTLFLYFKNYFAILNAFKNKSIKYNYIKIYKGDVPEYIEVLRQTLKNQFELPRFPINEKYGDLERFKLILNLFPIPYKSLKPKD